MAGAHPREVAKSCDQRVSIVPQQTPVHTPSSLRFPFVFDSGRLSPPPRSCERPMPQGPRHILGKQAKEIVIDLDIPIATVYRVLELWREEGRVTREKQKVGRLPQLQDEHIRVRWNYPFDLHRVPLETLC